MDINFIWKFILFWSKIVWKKLLLSKSAAAQLYILKILLSYVIIIPVCKEVYKYLIDFKFFFRFDFYDDDYDDVLLDVQNWQIISCRVHGCDSRSLIYVGEADKYL